MAMPAPSVLHGVQADADLWFEDGNVIVVAQQTAFRFHRGALSRHSEVFRGMFTVPQPPSPISAQNVEGCPVVDVTDTAHNFRNLLRAVYDGASVFPAVGAMEFGILASMVRMGHKYQFDPIVEEALRRLQTVFTPDFSIWETHQGTSNATVKHLPDNAIEAANLFLLTGRTDMLTTAFYMCGDLSVESLMNGVTRADGTPERLSPSDVQRCLTAQMALIKHDAQIMLHLLYQSYLPEGCICPTQHARREAMEWIQSEVLADFREVTGPLPIHRTHCALIVEMLQGEIELCNFCTNTMHACHTNLRRALWETLPALFQLDS